MLKVVIGKEEELIQEIPDVDAAKGIHLREGQNAREAYLLARSVRRVPRYIDNLVKLI